MDHPGWHMIEIDGETRSLREWSRLYGNSSQLILDRIKRGWDVEQAVTKPSRIYRSLKKRSDGDDAQQSG